MTNVSKGFNDYSEEFLEENRRFQALEKRLVKEATILEGAIYHHYNADGSFAGLTQTEPLEATKAERAAERERLRLENTTTNGGTATANTTTNGGTETANTTTNVGTETANTTTNEGGLVLNMPNRSDYPRTVAGHLEFTEDYKNYIDQINGKTEPPALKKNPVNTNPIIGEKPSEKPKFPPIIIQHPECGHITMGDEKDADVERPRDIGLYGGSANALRLFKDGGFELRSSDDDSEQETRGSMILQACKDGRLVIKSEGDLNIDVAGDFTVSANKIKMEALNASEDGINLKAKHDVRLEADNNVIIKGDNITIDAKERIVSHSEGWQILIGQCIRLHEPQTNLCPAFLREYIDEQIKTLKG